MKKIIFMFLIMLPNFLSAQTSTFKIEGIISDTTNAKFAYLLSPSKNDTLFKVRPVINGIFVFNDSCKLHDTFYRYGYIFFDNRPNVGLAELNSKLKPGGIWQLGSGSALKYIKLEDMKIAFVSYSQASNAKITAGGILSKQEDELALMMKNHTSSEFVKKYPNSPVSLNHLLRCMFFFSTPIAKVELEELWGNPKELFELLSDQLKNSVEGKKLKLDIDKYYK